MTDYCYADCHYAGFCCAECLQYALNAECHYAECHYADCPDAIFTTPHFF